MSADWQILTDPASGSQYYYNQKLNKTTWDRPPELGAAIATPAAATTTTPTAAAATTTPAAATPASPWTKHFDANSKSYYYYNTVTKATSWNDPSAPSTATTTTPAVAAAVTTPAPLSQPKPTVVAPTTPTAAKTTTNAATTPKVQPVPNSVVGTVPTFATIAPIQPLTINTTGAVAAPLSNNTNAAAATTSTACGAATGATTTTTTPPATTTTNTPPTPATPTGGGIAAKAAFLQQQSTTPKNSGPVTPRSSGGTGFGKTFTPSNNPTTTPTSSNRPVIAPSSNNRGAAAAAVAAALGGGKGMFAKPPGGGATTAPPANSSADGTTASKPATSPPTSAVQLPPMPAMPALTSVVPTFPPLPPGEPPVGTTKPANVTPPSSQRGMTTTAPVNPTAVQPLPQIVPLPTGMMAPITPSTIPPVVQPLPGMPPLPSGLPPPGFTAPPPPPTSTMPPPPAMPPLPAMNEPVPVAPAAPVPPTANELYDRFWDSNNNRYYFVGKLENASQWETPVGWVDPPATTNQTAPPAATPQPQPTVVQPIVNPTPTPVVMPAVTTMPSLAPLTVPNFTQPLPGTNTPPINLNKQFASLPAALTPSMMAGGGGGGGGGGTPQSMTPVQPRAAISIGTPTAPVATSNQSGAAKAAAAFVQFKPLRAEDNVVRMEHRTSMSAVPTHSRPPSMTLPANFSMPVPPGTDAKGRPAISQPLKADIAKFSLQGFAEQHFRSAKKSTAKKAIPMEQELSWQKDPIKKSLLAAAKAYDSACVKMFVAIQGFMLETGKRNAMQLLDQVITQGVQKPPLRDEIYCQLIKQTRNNPNPAGCVEGWKLLTIAVSSFPPTRGFENYILNYFIDNYDSPTEDVRVLAPFCYYRLHRTVKEGPEPMKLPEVESLVKAGGPKSTQVAWGGNIEYIISLQKLEGNPLDIPVIMHSLISIIKKNNGFQTKGVFRLAAEGSLVKNMVAQCKAGNYEMKGTDCLVPADVFKIWLRELAEPLVPMHLYETACKNAADPSAVQQLICSLPKPAYDTFDYLLTFLCELAATEPVTAMGPEQISVVFAPNLLRTNETDPNVLFKNEAKSRQFVKNALAIWQKLKGFPAQKK